MKKCLLPVLLFVLALSQTACYYDVEEELYPDQTVCENTSVTFSQHIEPLIVSICQNCHSNSNMSGNISLEGYDNIKERADNGDLMGAVNHEPSYTPMPQGQPKLPQCDIEAIQIWIDNGSPND